MYVPVSQVHQAWLHVSVAARTLQGSASPLPGQELIHRPVKNIIHPVIYVHM